MQEVKHYLKQIPTSPLLSAQVCLCFLLKHRITQPACPERRKLNSAMPEGMSMGSGWSGAIWVLLGYPSSGARAQGDKAASSPLLDKGGRTDSWLPSSGKNHRILLPRGRAEGWERGRDELCLLPLWLLRDSEVLGANWEELSTPEPPP